MKRDMLNFVRDKLEEGEGISPEALARVLSASPRALRPRRFWLMRSRGWGLLAASLAVAVCGLFLRCESDACREDDLLNVIALLQLESEEEPSEGASLADRLLAWQDAPCIALVN